MAHEKQDISLDEVIARRTMGSRVAVMFRLDRSFFAHILSPYNIGTNELAVLLQLHYFGELCQEQLVRFLAMDKTMLSKTAKRLAEQGYIYTTKSEMDRRVLYLGLTDKGRNFAPLIKSKTEEWLALITEGIDESEIATAKNVLDRMISNAMKAG